MLYRKVPPGRSSSFATLTLKPFGPNHFSRCPASVNACHTRLRGASKSRVVTNSPLPALAGVLFSDMLLLLFALFFFQLTQVGVQPVKALLPEAAVLLHPSCYFFQWRRLQPSRSPLRILSTRNQASLLQDL